LKVTKFKEIQTQKITTRGLVSENFLNLEFFMSVVIPIILFSVFNHLNMKLFGTIVAGVWSIGIVLIAFSRKHKFNIFGVIGAGVAAIALIGTIFSKNPTFYLVSPIVVDIILSAAFLGSALIGNPIIQILAEYSVKNGFSEELRKEPKYKSAWMILAVAWGVLSITQTLLRIVLFYTVSNEIYYAISTVYGNISTPLMLVFSFWFPRWYWKRKPISK